jgi:hypothetical protein
MVTEQAPNGARRTRLAIKEAWETEQTQSNTISTHMRLKHIAICLLAAALSAMTASAHILVTVLCPDSGKSAAGIMVCATLSTDSSVQICGDTDSNGFVGLIPHILGTYHVCVVSGLPVGAILSQPCQDIDWEAVDVPVEFDLSGPFCTGVPSACWETGGGTLDKVKGKPVWTFGGVIYPGCSPTAAGGGNLNIVNHVTGLHFKGTQFVVDDCRGVPTKSPKVTVNIIDWHGIGYVSGDDESKKTPVTFVGTFRDAHESGAKADGLYIKVVDLSGNLVFQIGGGPVDLDLLTTGNVQIHQSSCGK